MSDFATIIRTASTLEELLENRFQAQGAGLGAKARSIQSRIPSEVFEALKTIANVRNIMAHENVAGLAEIPAEDAAVFRLSCATVERFFGPNSLMMAANSQPNKPMNPFLKETLSAKWSQAYTSDDHVRAVWIKGTSAAEVPAKGTIRCPMWKFDKVAFVWMHEVQLPIDLAGKRFLSADNFEVNVRTSLTCKVIDTHPALIAVTTRFDETLPVLEADVSTAIREFCRTRQASEILKAEPELARAVTDAMGAPEACKVIHTLRTVVQLSVPAVEEVLGRERMQQQTEVREASEARLAEIRSSRDLADLQAKLMHESLKLEAECLFNERRVAQGVQHDTERLEYLQKVSALTDASRTAILHINPEIFRQLELAKLANSTEHTKDARDELLSLLHALAQVLKTTNSAGTNIVTRM